MANRGRNDKQSGFFLSLIRGSIILSALDRFTAYIYSLLKNGLFGYIFSGYNENMRSELLRKKRGSRKLSSYFAELRYGICRRIESSVIVNFITFLMNSLLRIRLKVYGAFLVSFGVYTVVIKIIQSLSYDNIAGLLEDVNILISVIIILASIPLALSKRSLSEALGVSAVGKLILSIVGYPIEKLNQFGGYIGRMNVAFVLGILCGIVTYWISPIYVLLAIAVIVVLYLILVRPEVGVVAMFIASPWLPTLVLAALVGYTTVCYFVKLFRGKRIIKLEPIDIVVIVFGVMLASGGFISLSSSSVKPALLMVCLLLGYFLVSQMITSREWLARCAVSCVISATAVAILGIIMYVFGIGYSSAAWVDSEMFAGITGRAIGTFSNPNVFGEYLILIIPIAVSMMIGKGEGLRRIPAALCVGVLGVCLIFTWSRGAWLALMAAAVMFLFMWHRRSVWLLIAGVVSIPILPSILPESIISRFTSIGNMADSSTSYRVFIWRASVNMIEDNLASGIGIGEGSWDLVYPLYTYMGVEAAPHSHNLYMQITLELGIFGILAFLVFLFMFYQSGFTLFRKLSGESSMLKTPDISERMLLSSNSYPYLTDSEKMRQGKNQIRISAAGPLCGIFAIIVQGMTDYSWYNYKVYLTFWIICGLAVAYIRSGNRLISGSEDTLAHIDDTSCDFEVSYSVSKKNSNNTTVKNEVIIKGEANE